MRLKSFLLDAYNHSIYDKKRIRRVPSCSRKRSIKNDLDITLGASSRWSSSLYDPTRNSDQMAIRKTCPSLESKLFSNKNREDGEFDLGRKVREDPLAMVKEKENERFKKLQANPQKMARMKKLMMAYMGGQESSDSSSASEDDEPKRFEIIFGCR